MRIQLLSVVFVLTNMAKSCYIYPPGLTELGYYYCENFCDLAFSFNNPAFFFILIGPMFVCSQRKQIRATSWTAPWERSASGRGTAPRPGASAPSPVPAWAITRAPDPCAARTALTTRVCAISGGSPAPMPSTCRWPSREDAVSYDSFESYRSRSQGYS